ncbi:MAG: hypothetical protein C6I05_07320 [Epsilonproteobacteria bacterium]|nr:hypothetical protein [Campylobacterota bacterium]
MIAAFGILVVASISLSTPQGESPQPAPTPESRASQSQERGDIEIVVTQKSRERESPKKVEEERPKKGEEERRDPTIKYRGLDHYSNYLIELIDTNPQDRDVVLKGDNYRVVTGKINGKQFALKVPKEILSSPDLKLRITDLKTKKKVTIGADFLNELAGLPEEASYSVEIDLNDPENIQTKAYLPDPQGVGAFPKL